MTMRIITSESFYPYLLDKSNYLIFYGGAGSGKSEFVGRKIFYRCMTEGNHLYVIFRKVGATLGDSVIPLMRSILEENGIEYKFNKDKSSRHLYFKNRAGKDNYILFRGLDDSDKAKSFKGITGLWLEETTEFSEYDFTQLDLRLRDDTGHYLQMIMTFNPDQSKAPWLKKMFFDKIKEGTTIHHSTINDNPIKIIRERYIKKLKDLDDPTYLRIYFKGLWAVSKGIIYKDYHLVSEIPRYYDSRIWGLDFGFNSETALVSITEKDKILYIKEELYETLLTNPDLIERLKLIMNDKRDVIYADSQEPARIADISRAGFNIKPGLKAVSDGIGQVKSMWEYIRVDGRSRNLIEERNTYKWKEKKGGETLDEPVKFRDHLMDAKRYAIYTHYRNYNNSAKDAIRSFKRKKRQGDSY